MTLCDKEIMRLFRIRKTLLQMLRDRGYFVTDEEIGMEKGEFLHKYGENMDREDIVIKKSKLNDSSDQIYVLFPKEEEEDKHRVRVTTLQKCIRQMRSDNVFLAILVVDKDLTSFAKTCVNVISTKLQLEIFQLPKIQITDPIARYYGLKHGQVVKITQPSETAGQRYITYRAVV